MPRLSHTSPGIRDLAFRPAHRDAQKAAVGFEIFRLAELFRRFASGAHDHAPEVPQRLEFHIAYVGLRGRGQLVVDFAPAPLGAGWLTVVASGQVQQFVPGSEPDAWMLLFSPEFLALGARDVDPLRGASVLAARTEPALALAAPERRELHALCELLAAEYARPFDAVQPAALAALLRAVLLRAERIATAARGPAGAPAAELTRFFTTLERDVLTTRSVAHYARATGVSPRRLGELLVAHAGRSTKQLIDERVALEAKRLLAHTDLSVKELADRTGFAEPTNFVKFFRHHAGTTPLAFRARFYHPAADPDLAPARARR